MRCLSLAACLRAQNWQVTIATLRESIETIPSIAEWPSVVELGSALDPLELRRAVPDNVDWLVVDHYALGADYEAAASGWAERVMAIDDVAQRPHSCDVLMDQTAGREPQEYEDLVPPHCRILTGSRFALLRPNFAELRPVALRRRQQSGGALQRVFVAFGGTDSLGLGPNVAVQLARSAPDLEIDLIRGGGCSRNDSALSEARVSPQIRLFDALPADRLAALMCEADLAVGAAGAMSWERCALGLPAALCIVAENQQDIAAALVRLAAGRSVGTPDLQTTDRLVQAVLQLRSAPEDLTAMAIAAAEICDGLGTTRVAEEFSR